MDRRKCGKTFTDVICFRTSFSRYKLVYSWEKWKGRINPDVCRSISLDVVEQNEWMKLGKMNATFCWEFMCTSCLPNIYSIQLLMRISSIQYNFCCCNQTKSGICRWMRFLYLNLKLDGNGSVLRSIFNKTTVTTVTTFLKLSTNEIQAWSYQNPFWSSAQNGSWHRNDRRIIMSGQCSWIEWIFTKIDNRIQSIANRLKKPFDFEKKPLFI